MTAIGGSLLRTSPNRLLATVFGAVYVLVGVLGIFAVNPLHNIAHLLIGAALLIAGLASVPAAKAVNTAVGAVYLLLGIIGFFIASTALNILALNTADHFLHVASAIVLLGAGLAADKTVSRTVTA